MLPLLSTLPTIVPVRVRGTRVSKGRWGFRGEGEGRGLLLVTCGTDPGVVTSTKPWAGPRWKLV